MSDKEALSRIAAIIGNWKSPQDQLVAISEVVFEAGEHSPAPEPVNSDYVWDDPMVIEACKEGRQAHDIHLIVCPKCNRATYWNEGSHFQCRFCGLLYQVTEEMADEAVSLADWGDDTYPIKDERRNAV